MLNKVADTIAYTYPFPAKTVNKNSTFTLSERGCYFLFFMFRIATISKAKVSMICNSSYVLIKNASFLPRLGTEVFTPYRLPGQAYYIFNVRGGNSRNGVIFAF